MEDYASFMYKAPNVFGLSMRNPKFLIIIEHIKSTPCSEAIMISKFIHLNMQPI